MKGTAKLRFSSYLWLRFKIESLEHQTRLTDIISVGYMLRACSYSHFDEDDIVQLLRLEGSCIHPPFDVTPQDKMWIDCTICWMIHKNVTPLILAARSYNLGRS